jgi:hypothetical protein
MAHDFRETMIRVSGVEQTIRTERGGKIRTPAQLESAHMKAVKAAILAARQSKLDAQYADRLADAEKPQQDAEGLPGSGERTRQNLVTQAKIWRHTHGTAAPVKSVAINYVDVRKGFPKVAFKSEVPDYFVEVAPGHYATAEAAKSMGVVEHADEILPGLILRRHGKGWAPYHLRSATDEKPLGVPLGPAFKTRKRAREVITRELGRFDWTRTAGELIADEETAAVVKFVKLREFVTASVRNDWAAPQLREAEAALAQFAQSAAA